MCSLCGETVEVSTQGYGLVLTVERPGHVARQELFAHPGCLSGALHPGVPFDAEMFED
jgi:hypothetical protein